MHIRSERPSFVHVVALAAVAAAAFTVAFVPPAHAAPAMNMTMMMKMTSSMSSMDMGASLKSMSMPTDKSLRGRFDFLSHQTSNQCNLQASTLAAYPATARLQGSCCSPMNYESYVKQIHELAAYSDSDIPRDPYNMSVPLARKLIAYNEKILLTAAQQRVYNKAMRMAEEGGPCCCHCWRWTAFEGQAKSLIARRRYTSHQIAELWEAEDGCGGDGHSGGIMNHGSGTMK